MQKEQSKQGLDHMLIEFSVENHRAFREKQTFTMVASGSAERADNVHVLDTGMSAVPAVLSESCVFGANGSGKSSLLDAMQFMRHLVLNSFHKKSDKRPDAEPFKFHSEWRKKPSEFEVVFFHDDSIYQYGFSIDHVRVLEEWLFVRPKKTQRERQIFTRIYDDENDQYTWEMNAEHLKGQRESWKDATREDALFLSTAVHMNANVLEVPFEWFRKFWRFLGSDTMRSINITDRRMKKEGWKQRIQNFMAEADIHFCDLRVTERDVPANVLAMAEALMKATDDSEDQSSESSESLSPKMIEISTVRKDETGDDIELPMDEESSGTQALFNLAAPILDVLDNGYVLFVDELNTNLHPLAFQHLVSLFAGSATNPHGAQLIFTTHDTSVADQECMARDQIWLVEKGNDLAAKLIPLSDFKERDAKGFQKKYLDGRFGGIPRVSI